VIVALELLHRLALARRGNDRREVRMLLAEAIDG
jgi:hypothetical protein